MSENNVEELSRRVEVLHDQYLDACKLVADMHKAAVGEIRGPIKGVVEDVAEIRAALEEAYEAFRAFPYLSYQPEPTTNELEQTDLVGNGSIKITLAQKQRMDAAVKRMQHALRK